MFDDVNKNSTQCPRHMFGPDSAISVTVQIVSTANSV